MTAPQQRIDQLSTEYRAARAVPEPGIPGLTKIIKWARAAMRLDWLYAEHAIQHPTDHALYKGEADLGRSLLNSAQIALAPVCSHNFIIDQCPTCTPVLPM